MIRKILRKLAKRYLKKTCNHRKKKVIYESYEESYVKYKCKKCKKRIYEDF